MIPLPNIDRETAKWWKFWRKAKTAPAPELPEAQPITFSADDNMHKRAKNIWYAIGFCNDRHNAIPQIAGYLSMYRDWDERKKS